MAKKLYTEESIADIADAIREKNGEATKYKVAEMGDAVRAIQTAEIYYSKFTVASDVSSGWYGVDVPIKLTSSQRRRAIVIIVPEVEYLTSGGFNHSGGCGGMLYQGDTVDYNHGSFCNKNITASSASTGIDPFSYTNGDASNGKVYINTANFRLKVGNKYEIRLIVR